MYRFVRLARDNRFMVILDHRQPEEQDIRMTEAQPFVLDIGATVVHGKGVRFKVWAPYAKEVAVKVTAPQERCSRCAAAIRVF